MRRNARKRTFLGMTLGMSFTSIGDDTKAMLAMALGPEDDLGKTATDIMTAEEAEKFWAIVPKG
jgi:hypothetical protein